MKNTDDLILELTKNCKTQEDFNDLFRPLKKRGLEAALSGELTDHLSYDKHERSSARISNGRNSYSKKTVATAQGRLELEIPRNRDGAFEPQLIECHQTRFDGIDEKITSLYARGLSVRDIQEELSDIYGADTIEAAELALNDFNAIESLNMSLRKVIKNKRVFPSDDSVFKLIYLAIKNISKKWTMPIHNWKPAMNQFMIRFDQLQD